MSAERLREIEGDEISRFPMRPSREGRARKKRRRKPDRARGVFMRLLSGETAPRLFECFLVAMRSDRLKQTPRTTTRRFSSGVLQTARNQLIDINGQSGGGDPTWMRKDNRERGGRAAAPCPVYCQPPPSQTPSSTLPPQSVCPSVSSPLAHPQSATQPQRPST